MKKKRMQPPVQTGHDDRSEERQRGEQQETGAEAPDGISGDWG
jgi:hypothetical protein